MAISSGNLTLLRNSGIHVTRPVYNFWPAQTVVTGTISNTPLEYPIGQVSVSWASGAWANIKVGQLFIIKQVNETVTYGVVRKTPTSSILYIDGKSRGDGGRAVSQEVAVTSGQTVTVYTFRPLWALLSRIKDGTFLKRFDIPYDGSGSNPPPVVNLGSWQQVWADDTTGLGTVSFTNANNYYWLSKTPSTYSWSVPGTATYLSGNSSSSAITITLPQGFHIIECTVVDSGSASMTAIRPVWVNGPDFLPLSDDYLVIPSGDSQDRKSRNQSMTVFGDFDEATFLPGGAIHYHEEPYFDGQQLSDSSILIDNFVGFASEETPVHEPVNGKKATTFQLDGPWLWMEKIPMVSQAIVEVSSPGDWTDVAPTLGTPDFIAWYILYHHSTYLTMFDYYPLDETVDVRKLNWGVNGSVMSDYLNFVSSVIGGNIGCASDGSLYLRRDPNLEEEDEYRGDLDTVMTITVDETTGLMDVVEPIEIPRQFFNQVGQLRVFALVFNGSETTAYASIAPGYTQMQASGSQDEDSFIIKPDSGLNPGDPGYYLGGQDKVNAVCGHVLARANNPYSEISLAMNRNMDVGDPAKMLWYELDIPSNWSPRGIAISDRVLLNSIERSWEEAEGNAYVKRVTFNVGRQTFGQPGETFLLDKGGGSLYAPRTPPSLLEDSFFESQLGFLIGIDDNGRIGRTTNGVNWMDIQGAMTGRCNDITFDLYCDFVTSGFTEGALSAWVVTANEEIADSSVYNQIEVWYAGNILTNNVTWTLQETVIASADVDRTLRIKYCPDLQDYLAVVSNDGNGLYVMRSTDAGQTWSNGGYGTTVVDNSIGSENLPIGMDFKDTSLIVSAYSGGDSAWLLAYFADESSGLSYVTGSPLSDVPWPMVKYDPENDRTYATRIIRDERTGTGSMTWQVVDDGFGNAVTQKSATGIASNLDWSPLVTISTPTATPVIDYYNPPTTDICQVINPHLADDGWQVGTSLAGTGDRDFEALIAINGWATMTGGSISGEWSIPDGNYGACTIVPLLGTVGTINSYTFGSVLVNQHFESCINEDPDGWDVLTSVTSATDCTVSNFDSYPNPLVTKVYYRYLHHGKSPVFPNFLVRSIVLNISYVMREEPEMYRISALTGSAVFTSISPSSPEDEYLSRFPYALSVDPANPDTLDAVLTGPGFDDRISISEDLGSTWTLDTEDGDWRGIKLVNGYGFAWGYNKIYITDDAFVSSTNVYGDWSSSIGAAGFFRVVNGVV